MSGGYNVRDLIKLPFIQIEGLKKTVTYLGLAADKAVSLKPCWESIARYVAQVSAVTFMRGGAKEGWAGWAPLSSAYAEHKARVGYTGGILIREGRLRASVCERGSSNFIFRTAARSMSISTSVPYAGYMNRGTRTVPARSLLRLTKTDNKTLTAIIQRFVLSHGGERVNL